MTGRTPPTDDEFERHVCDWLADRGRPDPWQRDLFEGHVMALPARSLRRVPLIAAAAVVAVAMLATALVASRPMIPGAGADGSREPDPVAFAGDPRLASCRDELADVDRVFEMTHARWFPLYFPGWWKGAPELEVDDAALVVIETPRIWPTTGGLPRDPSGGSPLPTQPPAYRVCIAVGPPGRATVHVYGPTSFRTIVPVLSDQDVARAANMDPKVLADPASWQDPDRLAPCGGLTGHVQYLFEATPLSDFDRYFPAAGPVPELELDEVGTIVVFRGAMELDLPRLAAANAPATFGGQDVCVIFSEPNPLGPAVLLPTIPMDGFHVRLTDAELDGPTAAPSLTETTSPAPEPAPAWAADLGGQLECDGPVASIGGEPPDAFGVGLPGLTPEEALTSFLEPGNPFAALPATGYSEVHQADHWASFAHLKDGRARAIILLSDSAMRTGPAGRWVVVGLRACDASEFDPTVPLTFPITVWTDTAGSPVPTTEVRSVPGPEHCGWETAIFLRVGDDTYFRDPEGAMGEWTTTPFDPNATLPRRARDTGYRTDDWQLWIVDGGDVYMVLPDRVERWPRSTDPGIACA